MLFYIFLILFALGLLFFQKCYLKEQFVICSALWLLQPIMFTLYVAPYKGKGQGLVAPFKQGGNKK